MAITQVNLGTLPDGVGGDTPRSAMVKINSNFGINSSGVYAANENAASRLVGEAAGNVMEVGAFGLGVNSLSATTDAPLAVGEKNIFARKVCAMSI